MSNVIVGKIINTCGLKGELKVSNYSDFVKERYKKGNVVSVINDDETINEELTVASFRCNDKFLYVRFEGIDTIEKAEKYKGSSIYVDTSVLKKIDDDTFYYYELLNMEVYFDNKLIGKISEVNDYGAQDIIRVDTNKESILVPFINDFIESVDVSNKKIVLKNIEGLL